MAGKAYTMREMKSMVEYLTEHKAYSQIKGRKMWMEFANSGKTPRTWQSLKETFIKRILPDLHNPYYRLTLDQVRSFREGKDVAEKERHNRLEYVTTSEDSVTTSEVRNNKNTIPTEAATTSKGEGLDDLDEEVERVTGEDTAAKINSRNRSSADTVVLETYDNAEQLQDVLESPSRREDEVKPTKDLLIFEPMTPLVKELLEDFETESEHDNEEEEPAKGNDPKATEDNQVKIETSESDERNPAENQASDEVIEIHDSEDLNGGEVPHTDENNLQNKSHNLKPQDEENNNGNEAEEQTNNHDSNTIITVQDTEDFVTAEANSKTVDSTVIPPNVTKRNSDQTQISGISTSDSILPNNQECLNNTKKTENIVKPAEVKENRKRSSSQDRNGQKKKLANDKSVIEIEDSPYICEDAPFIEINSDIPDIGATVEIRVNGTNRNNAEVHGNPCLQSVSLFEEQFKTTQYSSDSDNKAPTPEEDQVVEKPHKEIVIEAQKKNVDKPEKKITENNQKKDFEKNQKNVLEKPQQKTVETPHKETESMNMDTPQEKNKGTSSSLKAELSQQAKVAEKPSTVKNKKLLSHRDQVLANVFGFTNGGPSTLRQSQSRKSRQTHKAFHQHHHRAKSESNSSEWMSESDSDDYISPPRHSRQRKYLKPKPSKILHHPEDGMLYVMFGKNIYPLVKSDKRGKNFVTYNPDSESDSDDESFWKKKYIEEKKKLQDLKMLLDGKDNETNDRASPILQCKAKKSTSAAPKAEHIVIDDEEKPTAQEENKSKDEKLVLKFATGHGEELRLEGGWSQISSAIPQMMQMLRNNPTSDSNKEKPALKIQAQNPRHSNVSEMEITSGKSTPTINVTTHVDPEVHEKVNQIETEIFKEIEEREREEQTKENETLLTVNVAKRTRGRPRKTPSPASSSETPNKKPKTTKDATDSKREQTEAKETKNVKKRSSETATTSKNVKAKQAEAMTNKSEEAELSTSISKQKNSIEKTDPSEQNTETSEQKQIKESKVVKDKSKFRTSLRLSNQRDSESRDKDVIIEKLPVRPLRTPKKNDTDSSASEVGSRTRRSATKEKEKFIKNIDFEDDNIRFMLAPSPKNKIATKGRQGKSPGRHVLENLKSQDSTQGYQDSDISPLKLNIKRKRRVSVTAHKKQHRRLKRRNSYPTLLHDLITVDSSNSSYFVPVRKLPATTNSEIYRSDSYQLLMPQPKAVRKMEPIDENNPRHFGAVTKDSSEKSSELNILVEIGSSSNVSLPLSPELSIVENLSISRDIIINHNASDPLSYESDDKIDHNDYIIPEVDVSIPLMQQQCKPKGKPKVTPNKNPLTDTFMRKVSTVNLKEDPTLSDTLDQRLRDLLLGSGKKNHNDKENAMEVDPPNEPVKIKAKNGKTKKRCSTPRKKNTAQKAKGRKDAIIEEEHVETCSFGGRKSCPPVITLICDDNANDCTDIKQNKTVKKKDIIKVKIQRPKKKSGENKTPEISVGNITSYTDSGINDAEISEMLKGADHSVDLIHNHSETCLLANECINDSVEIVENSKSSVISVDNSTIDSDLRRLLEEDTDVSGELFGTAQENPNSVPKSETPTTLYHSPTWTSNSLLTDDLSDEVNQPTYTKKPGWYLLAEDETNTQSNFNINVVADLNKLFPVACAVPDLSSISEMSRENEDSRRSQSNVGGDSEMNELLSMF